MTAVLEDRVAGAADDSRSYDEVIRPAPRKKRAIPRDSFGLPVDSALKRLKMSREVAYYLVTRGYEIPDCPPKIKTLEPRRLRGAVFDPEKVDKVVEAFKHLQHTQGRLAGKPLNPDPWQIAYIIAPVFGWVRKNEFGEYTRIIKKVLVDIPRKNGKSTLVGGLGLYLTAADGEPAAQVVAAATVKDQARFVFDPIRQLAEKSPALKGHVRALNSVITHPRTGSTFKVIASGAEAQHGANIHGAVIDELHLHKTPDLVEAIETGTGSRDQPLIFMITTADEGKPNTVYARKRRYIEQLASGVLTDHTHYGVVWGADEDDDLFAESTLRKANPGFGVSPTRQFLLDAAKEAQNSPAQLAAYKRLHLGLRTKQTTAYLDLKAWKRNAGPALAEADLYGRSCWGGLDLGSVSDLTALAWIFPFSETDDDGRPIGYDLLFRFWTPEENLVKLDGRTGNAASQLWAKEGWLTTTEGDVTDYDFVEAQIRDDAERFDVTSIGFDRWNASQLVNNLIADGVPVVKIGQGYATMNPALREIQRLMLLGRRGEPKLRHGGNPVMTWMVDNLAVKTDPAGNVKPDKENAADKIDGVSALCNAMSEALTTAPPQMAPGHLFIA